MPRAKKPSKRTLPSLDLSPTPKRRRTLPTPDNTSHFPSVEEKDQVPADRVPTDRVPAGPANPGVIRSRDEGALSKLPPDSDVFETFTSLRRDGNLSHEEAFLKLITTYDVPLSTLNRISSNLYPTLLYHQFLCVAPCSYINNTIHDSQQKDYRYLSVTSNIRI